MRVEGKDRRTIWAPAGGDVSILDQARLPYELRVVELRTAADAARAIREMWVRGAPLIGAAAAYGLALAIREDPSDAAIDRASAALRETRPTAVNLAWALREVREAVLPLPPAGRAGRAYARAAELCEDDVRTCRAIGEHGARLLREAYERGGRARPVQVLTHCNAGWLATVDWGTALSPIYLAHREGIPVHVWVDETRPRSQGLLTAWELGQEGVPHTLVADNAGGHLMQRGLVDLCIVGTDRTTSRGDVCNKIGTYLKALAAHDNKVPFCVAAPHSSIDWTLEDGVRDIPIEQRDVAEVLRITGRCDGQLRTVEIGPPGVRARNDAFDVTPARLVTWIVTERGMCPASREGLLSLYPERR